MNTDMEKLKQYSFVLLLGIGVVASWGVRLVLEDTTSVTNISGLQNHAGSIIAIVISIVCIELILPATESSATTGETTLVAEKNNPRLARHKFPDEITKLVRSNKKLKEDNTKITELLDEKEADIEQKDTRLRKELFVSKGIDPPCWYKKVPGISEREREKPYYLMDIAVHAEHLLVRLRHAPPGRGFELLGGPAITPYAEEYAQLPLSPFRSTNKFSLEEFIKWSTPIKRRGKNKQVRDYPCVFYVAVWDKTPETAKENTCHPRRI